MEKAKSRKIKMEKLQYTPYLYSNKLPKIIFYDSWWNASTLLTRLPVEGNEVDSERVKMCHQSHWFLPSKTTQSETKTAFFAVSAEYFFGCASLSKIFLSQRASELFFLLSKSVTRLLTSDIFLHFHIVDLFMGYCGRESRGIWTDGRKL